jgi:uncharacterized protein (TIGR02246 family)
MKTIDALIKTYETALNAGDLETILSLYGSEPVFMPQNAPALVGRDAVRAGYQHVFDTLRLAIAFSIHDLEVTGDWAWARTSSAGRTRILAAGVEVTEGNNELFVFRRERSEWRIHRYLFSTNQPRALGVMPWTREPFGSSPRSPRSRRARRWWDVQTAARPSLAPRAGHRPTRPRTRRFAR